MINATPKGDAIFDQRRTTWRFRIRVVPKDSASPEAVFRLARSKSDSAPMNGQFTGGFRHHYNPLIVGDQRAVKIDSCITRMSTETRL